MKLNLVFFFGLTVGTLGIVAQAVDLPEGRICHLHIDKPNEIAEILFTMRNNIPNRFKLRDFHCHWNHLSNSNLQDLVAAGYDVTSVRINETVDVNELERNKLLERWNLSTPPKYIFQEIKLELEHPRGESVPPIVSTCLSIKPVDK
jgi:hypothetical protein